MIDYKEFVETSFKYKKTLADIFAAGNIHHLLIGELRVWASKDGPTHWQPISLDPEDSVILMYLKGVDYEVLMETDMIYNKIIERLEYYESKKGKAEIIRQKLESTEKG